MSNITPTTTNLAKRCACSRIAEILWGDGAEVDWSPDTLDAISDAVCTLRPDLFTKHTGEDPFS